jgi:hypothetical protein
MRSQKLYTKCGFMVNGKAVTRLLHRFILEVEDPKVQVDHKDGDGLNCRRSNIRICTDTQNKQNKGPSSLNKSGFRGVHKFKATGKYQAQIRVNGKLLHLGYFIDRFDAARAYNKAAKKYFGEFAFQNKVPS